MSGKNSLSGLREYMSSAELPLYNQPSPPDWLSGAVNGMGLINSYTGLPTHFTNNLTTPEPLFGDWNAMSAWWVIHAATTHTKNNTRCNVGPLFVYGLRNGIWGLINEGATYLNWQDPSSSSDYRVENDGSRSYQFQESLTRMHGSTIKFPVAYNDYECIYISQEVRLVLDDTEGVDDRVKSRILACVGADYWKTTSTVIGDFASNNFAPACGNGALRIVNKSPRLSQFVTSFRETENIGYTVSPRTITLTNLLKNNPPTIKKQSAATYNLIRLRK